MGVCICDRPMSDDGFGFAADDDEDVEHGLSGSRPLFFARALSSF